MTNPTSATIIEVLVCIASVWGLIVAIKPFLFKKNRERETIHRSARNQSTLIDRRIKK